MPSWAKILKEIETKNAENQAIEAPWNSIRRKYLLLLHNHTKRNIIAWYSGWLQNPTLDVCSVSDFDKNGLMNAVHGLNKDLGLDLLLHTPGGDFAATESLVDYLHKIFGTNIRCFVPQMAMSSGTMIACACKEIFMGKQSNLGPIDPQFAGVPAHGVIAEFNEAIESATRNPASIPIWQAIIGRYHPTFIGECRNAIELASEIVERWLIRGMFSDDEQAEEKAKRIVKKLNNHADTKMHARHIHAEEAVEFGLKISMLENDNELQDLVLTVHHAYMHSFSVSKAVKVIENHEGHAIVLNE